MSESDLIYHMRINNTGKPEKYEVSCSRFKTGNSWIGDMMQGQKIMML